MAKHMAGKNQRPYSAEDRARRAAKADPRSTASELTPETLYAKQSSQSEKRVPSSIENLHFTPKSPKNGPEGFEETREYPAPAAPQQEAPRSERPAPAPAPRPEQMCIRDRLPFGTPGREETCIRTPLALLFMGFSLLLHKLLKY